MDKKQLNVVIIHSAFWVGGAENMVYELAKNLTAQNVNVTVITLHSRVGSHLEEKVDAAEFRNIYVGCEGGVTPKKLLAVYKMCQEANADVVHAHMSGVVYSILWALTPKGKMIATAHTTPDKAFNKRTTAVLKLLARLNKAVIVAVSKENQKLIKEYYFLNKNVEYINNGVDLHRFYHKEHEGVNFVNVSRQDKNKNQAVILKLFSRLHKEFPDTQLYLCGDGPEQENLIAMTKELMVEDVVHFPGSVSNVEDYLALGDIYIQASHREGLPLSTVEGMASGLPVITTDVGGMKNLIDNNGFLLKDGDEEGMYNAMVSLVQDQKKREAFGKRSVEISKDFSSESMAEKYKDLYEKCR